MCLWYRRTLLKINMPSKSRTQKRNADVSPAHGSGTSPIRVRLTSCLERIKKTIAVGRPYDRGLVALVEEIHPVTKNAYAGQYASMYTNGSGWHCPAPLRAMATWQSYHTLHNTTGPGAYACRNQEL